MAFIVFIHFIGFWLNVKKKTEGKTFYAVYNEYNVQYFVVLISSQWV